MFLGVNLAFLFFLPTIQCFEMHDKVAGQEFYRHDPSDDVCEHHIHNFSLHGKKKWGFFSARHLCFGTKSTSHILLSLSSRIVIYANGLRSRESVVWYWCRHFSENLFWDVYLTELLLSRISWNNFTKGSRAVVKVPLGVACLFHSLRIDYQGMGIASQQCWQY